MKTRHLLIGLIAAPLLAYGSVKLYLHSKIADALEQGARAIAPFATLRWGDIRTTLTGEASIHDLRLDLRRPADTITVESITYDTPNIWYLLRDLGQVNNRRIPGSLHLLVKGLSLDLYGDLVGELEQAVNGMNLDLAGVSKLCGGRLFMGPRELRDMGYEAIVIDADMGFDIDTITEEMTLSLQLAAREMAAARISSTLSGFLGTPLQDQVPAPNKARMGPLRIRISDRDYMKRKVTYCARLSELGISEYIEEEVHQPPAYFANLWGIVPGPGLREAYRRYLGDPRTIEVRMDWPDEVTPESLRLFKASDIPELLNLEVKVNDERVNDLAFTFYNGRRVEFGNRFRKLFSESSQTGADSRKKAPGTRYRESYHPVAPTRLGDYLDHEVRLRTERGQIRQGTLTRVSGNIAYVERSLHGGKFTMQVPISTISKAEVLLRTPVE